MKRSNSDDSDLSKEQIARVEKAEKVERQKAVVC